MRKTQGPSLSTDPRSPDSRCLNNTKEETNYLFRLCLGAAETGSSGDLA